MIKTSLLNARQTIFNDRDFSAFQRDLVKEGVVDVNNDGNDLKVSAQGGNMTLDVNVGACYVSVTLTGYWKDDGTGTSVFETYPSALDHVVRVETDTIVNLTVSQNTSGSTRTDFVVVEVDTAIEPDVLGGNVGTIKIIEGQTAGVDAGANRFKLAEVTVANNASSIEAVDLLDTIYFVRLKPVTFDPTSPQGHSHDGVDSAKISSSNATVSPAGNISSTNVQSALEELDTEKSGTTHTHTLSGVTDVTLTATQLNRNLASDGEKDALAGAGTPSSANPYATKSFAEQLVASAGTGGMRVVNFFSVDTMRAVYDQKYNLATDSIYDGTVITNGTNNLKVLQDDFDTYGNYFQTISNFNGEVGETYTNGAFDTVTANRKQGTQSRGVTLATDSTLALSVLFNAYKDLSGFTNNSDKIVFWVKVDLQANIDLADLSIQTGVSYATTEYKASFFSQLTANGWNRIELLKSDFTATNTPNWAEVKNIRIEISTNTVGGCSFNFDAMQMQASTNVSNGAYTESLGFWDIRNISTVNWYMETDEGVSVVNSLLTAGNQSRTYADAIFESDFITILRNTTKAGLIFRYVDANNYYYISVNTTANTIDLRKVLAGTDTLLQTNAFTFAIDTVYRLRITFSGSNLTMEISSNSGVSYTTYTTVVDTSHTGGQIGFIASDGQEGFRAVSVSKIATTSSKVYGGKIVRINHHKGFGDEGDGYETNYNIAYRGDDITKFTNTIDDVAAGNFSLYGGGQKITSTAGAITTSVFTPSNSLDFSVYSDGVATQGADNFALFLFVDDSTILESFKIRFITSTGNYYEHIYTGIVTGLNRLTVLKSALTTTGVPSWNNITSIETEVKATLTNTVNCTVNALRLIKSAGIVFDTYASSGGGEWEVDNLNLERQIVNTNRTSGEYRLLANTSGNADQIINNPTIRLRLQGEGGVMFRYTDTDNFYSLVYTNGKVSLKKKVAGVYTVLGEEAFISITGQYTLSLIADGSSISYSISTDNQVFTEIASITDSEFTGGTFGLIANGNGLTHIDEFEIIEKDTGADNYDLLYYDANDVIISVIRKP